MVPAVHAVGARDVGDGTPGVDDEGEFLGRGPDVDSSGVVPGGKEVVVETHLGAGGGGIAGGEAAVEEGDGLAGTDGGIGASGEDERQHQRRRREGGGGGGSGHLSGEEDEEERDGGELIPRSHRHCSFRERNLRVLFYSVGRG